MKKLLMLVLCFYATLLSAAPTKEEAAAETQWENTTLSDALIQKIQAASYDYKVCTGNELQKPAYATIDFRKATDEIIKQCEPVLGKMREAYKTEKVPDLIIDRQLKTMRIHTTRTVLTEMMFRDAARKANADSLMPKTEAAK